MKKLLYKVAKVAIPASLLPFVASAQAINTVLTNIRTTLNLVIALLFVIITIYFIWGVIQYISASGDEEKLKAGKQHMLWGIIGLAVVGAAWGIASLIWTYLGVSGGTGGVIIPQF
jgi:TRAP-type C4-dicarboxylate transport system permease small subunit